MIIGIANGYMNKHLHEIIDNEAPFTFHDKCKEDSDSSDEEEEEATHNERNGVILWKSSNLI